MSPFNLCNGLSSMEIIAVGEEGGASGIRSKSGEEKEEKRGEKPPCGPGKGRATLETGITGSLHMATPVLQQPPSDCGGRGH